MATPTVLPGNVIYPTSFESKDNVSINSPETIKQYAGNVNFLFLIADTYMKIEEINNRKLEVHNVKLEDTMEKIETVGKLLKDLRTKLVNTYSKEDIQLDADTVKKMNEHYPNQALLGTKEQPITRMSRELANTVFKEFTDKNNMLNSDFRKLSTQANHFLEDATKILSLVEKLMENYRSLIERIQSKSRGA
ncbi:MAG TPA: hypothetical protein VMR37_01415 [Rhabdochlamydiaceae bacterium]|nr:hypothetical protein [Rhabdochlamydiaceae bacterium]